MNINLVARPAMSRPLVSSLPWPSCPAIVGRRYESSFRRTKQRLRVKPDPSFILTSSSPQQDHIIFNPPSSAPSVYHTPHKFLPKEDRRYDLVSPSSHSNSASPARLPPTVRKPPQAKKYHLVEKDLEEIRRLRAENPEKHSRAALAKKFGCSPLFIGIVCEASKKHKDAQLAKVDEVKAKWGRRKTLAREDRSRRRETWGRDDDIKEDPKYLRSLGPAYEQAQAALTEIQDGGHGR